MNATQTSEIPILSPVLFMQVGDPYIPPFIYLLYHVYCVHVCSRSPVTRGESLCTVHAHITCMYMFICILHVLYMYMYTACIYCMCIPLLQVNPVKRITIQGIREHRWFTVSLPDYLFPLGDPGASHMDSLALSEVCQKLGVPSHEVVAAVRGGEWQFVCGGERGWGGGVHGMLVPGGLIMGTY